MSGRPFRFGVSLGDFHDRADFVATVRRIEDAGFHVIAGVDHIGPPLGVMPMLATAAAISNLRVSPMVIANDYRHPVILAKDAATIDVLSGGRFELGIGTGWIRHQYESAGLPYDPAGVRVDRLAEALEVIRGCWTAEPYTFTGEHYTVNITGSPKPVQPGGPPILIGAAGERMLRLAARKADIVGITVTKGQTGFDTFAAAVLTSGERIEHQLEVVRDAAGSRLDELELSVAIHYSERDVDAAHAAATEAGVDRDVLFTSPHVLVGPPEQMADALVERRERYGFSYISFRGAELDNIEPVVRILSGT